MRLVRRFPALAFALVLLSIVGFCVAQQSAQMLLFAGALAAMSWYVTEGPRGRALPKWTSNVLYIAVCLNVFVDIIQNLHDPMGVLGRFAVWLTLIKLYERKTPRDYAQILALSLLMMLTGCMKSADLLFALVLLVYSVLGLYVLLLFQLYTSYERARAARLVAIPTGYRLVPPLRPIIGRRVGWHFRGLAVIVGLAGFVLSVAVFALVPRDVGRGMISALGSPIAGQRSAFTDRVDLSVGGRITDSRRTAMNVRVLDSRGQPVMLPEPLLLRGAVLDDYDNRGAWRMRPGQAVETSAVPDSMQPLGRGEAEPGLAYVQEFEVLINSPALFSTSVPVAVSTENPTIVRFDIRRWTLTTPRNDQPPRRYRVTAQPAPSDATLTKLAGASAGDPRRIMGYGNLEVRDEAIRLLREADMQAESPQDLDARWTWNRDAAKVFTAHLQSGAFRYTTDLSDIVDDELGQDPIPRFLFRAKRGHCEYFAAALVGLCRSVGVEARLITGFVASEFDDSSKQYIVREGNAHAWAEVRTGPRRWTTVDPTPPQDFQQIHSPSNTLADRLRWIYDRFEVRWSDSVIGFSHITQRQMIENFNMGWGARLSALSAQMKETAFRVNQFFSLGPAGYVWMGMVGLAIIIAVLALVTIMRRSAMLRRTARLHHLYGSELRGMLSQVSFYLDMLQVLARARRPKPTWQPPLQFADGVSKSQPELGDLVRRVTDLFYAARYGQRRLDRNELAEARALVRELADRLRVRA